MTLQGFWAIALALSVVACKERPAPLPGTYFQESVRAAKRLGKSGIAGTINTHYPEADIRTVSDAVVTYSLVVVTPTRLRIATWHDDDDAIVTYHAVRIAEVISRPEAGDRDCQPRIQQAALRPDEWLMPLFGGTASIDGVSITISDRVGELGPVLKVGKRYLLIGKECESPDELISPLGAGGIFELSNDQILPSAVGIEIGMELAALETLSQLRVQVRAESLL